MFDDDFLDKLPDDPQLAGKVMCDKVAEADRGFRTTAIRVQHYNDYLRALGIFQAYAETHGFEIEFPDQFGSEETNIETILKFFSDARNDFDKQYTRSTANEYGKMFAVKYGKIFVYEFSEDDLEKIQASVNELRRLITESKQIEDPEFNS